MGIPHRHSVQSHDDHGNFDSWPHHLLVSIASADHFPSFLHFAGVNGIKIWHMQHKPPKFYQPDSSTRNSYEDFSKTSPNIVIDALIDNNGNDNWNTTKTTMLPPTTLEGSTAPYPIS